MGLDAGRSAQRSFAHNCTRSNSVKRVQVAVREVARRVHDVSGLLKLAAARSQALVAIDLGVDTSTPTVKLVANVMMLVAEWEREVIRERTSAAMQAAKRLGRHMGRVSALPQATGDRLLKLRARHTLAGTATQLNAAGLSAAMAAQWSANSVAKALARLRAA